jgi:GTPase SAR1 family protein
MACAPDDGTIDDEISDDFLSQIHHLTPIDKANIHILVIGHTGHGKSSLVNMLFGGEEPVASVSHSGKSFKHEPIEHHVATIQGTNTKVHFYDTRGLGDSEKEFSTGTVLKKIRQSGEKFDLILFCHRLYDRIDESTHKELIHLAEFGDEFFRRLIYVFTFGDEYLTRSEVYRTNKRKKVRGKDIEGVGDEMNRVANEMRNYFNEILMSTNKIDCNVIKEIPFCITSGVQPELPTSLNWPLDLCKLIKFRCPEESTDFMSWWMEHRMRILQCTVAGAISGRALGGVGGLLVGSIIGFAVGVIGGEILGDNTSDHQKKET